MSSANSIDDDVYLTASDAGDESDTPCSPAPLSTGSSTVTHLAELIDGLNFKKKKKKQKSKKLIKSTDTETEPLGTLLHPDGTASLECMSCGGGQRLNTVQVLGLLRKRILPQYCKSCVFGAYQLKNIQPKTVRILCACSCVFEYQTSAVEICRNRVVVPKCPTCVDADGADGAEDISKTSPRQAATALQKTWRRHRARQLLLLLKCARRATQRSAARVAAATIVQCATRQRHARQRRRALACVAAIRARASSQPSPPRLPPGFQLPVHSALPSTQITMDSATLMSVLRRSVALELQRRDAAIAELQARNEQQWWHQQQWQHYDAWMAEQNAWRADEYASYTQSNTYHTEFPELVVRHTRQ